MAEDTSLVVPAVPDTNLGPWSVDARIVLLAEQRLGEVAYVNQATAPELAACFNKGANECGKILAKATHALNQAMRAADRRAAVVALDHAMDILTKKGLTSTKSPTGSDALRKAVVDTDEQYQAIMDRVDQLEAMQRLLSTKMKALERAFWQVRKATDPKATDFNGEEGSQPVVRGSSRFGNPKY